MISVDDFKKVEMKIGTILSAEKVADADKLLKLSVDFGLKPFVVPGVPAEGEALVESVERERDVRQVVSGIALHFPDPQELVGRSFPFVTNLEPRVIRGLESQAMILAVGDGDAFALLVPTAPVPSGALLR